MPRRVYNLSTATIEKIDQLRDILDDGRVFRRQVVERAIAELYERNRWRLDAVDTPREAEEP